jgi:hypothetical protein
MTRGGMSAQDDRGGKGVGMIEINFKEKYKFEGN